MSSESALQLVEQPGHDKLVIDRRNIVQEKNYSTVLYYSTIELYSRQATAASQAIGYKALQYSTVLHYILTL